MKKVSTQSEAVESIPVVITDRQGAKACFLNSYEEGKGFQKSVVPWTLVQIEPGVSLIAAYDPITKRVAVGDKATVIKPLAGKEQTMNKKPAPAPEKPKKKAIKHKTVHVVHHAELKKHILLTPELPHEPIIIVPENMPHEEAQKIIAEKADKKNWLSWLFGGGE